MLLAANVSTQNWSDVVPWLGVSDQTSRGVLYTLQRSDGLIGHTSDGRLGKACVYSVAVVQSAEHECHNQTLGDFFTSRVTDLTQSPQLKEATADKTTHQLLQRQFIVKLDTKISYDFDQLDDVITD